MDTAIIAAIIGALALIIASLFPYLRPRVRYLIVLLVTCGFLIFWIFYKLCLTKEQVIAELKFGLNNPPVFETPLRATDSMYETVRWTTIIKIVNSGSSEITVKNIQCVFKGKDGRKSGAKSYGKPCIECTPTIETLDRILTEKMEFVHFPFIIHANTELYLRVSFRLQLFDVNGHRLKYKFLWTGYEMLPMIMGTPSIEIVLAKGRKIKVEMQEYYPWFVGQKLEVSQGVIGEVWETSLGNIHTSQLNHFGIFWKAHVKIRKKAGTVETREWFNELPWYRGESIKTESRILTFRSTDVAPFIKVSQYGQNPVRFYFVGIMDGELKQGESLNLNRYIFKEGRLTFDKEIPLRFLADKDLNCKTADLKWEGQDGKQYRYIFVYRKHNQLLFWPFELYHIKSLLIRRESGTERRHSS